MNARHAAPVSGMTPRPPLSLAIDIGGTKVEAALVADGVVHTPSRTRAATGPELTPAQMRDALHTVITGALQQMASPREVTAVGVGSAGPIDRSGGTISPLNLPRLRDYPVLDVVREIMPIPVPVTVGLDGHCIAVAEWTYGAGRGQEHLLSMVVSTGVGGGLVCNGRPVAGADGNAGHIGQVRVSAFDGTDPRTGTLEEVASGPAAVRWAQQHGWAGATGHDLVASVHAGDATAVAAVARSAGAVGEALAGVAALTGVDHVIIGGGFALHAPNYQTLVAQSAHRAAVLPAAARLRVLRPELEDDAPLVGASLLGAF